MTIFIIVMTITGAYTAYKMQQVSGLEEKVEVLTEANNDLTQHILVLENENNTLNDTLLLAERTLLDLRGSIKDLFENLPTENSYSREDMITIGERACKAFNDTYEDTAKDLLNDRFSDRFQQGFDAGFVKGYAQGYDDVSGVLSSSYEEIYISMSSLPLIYLSIIIGLGISLLFYYRLLRKNLR